MNKVKSQQQNLRDLIKASGAISISAFMNEVLFHPKYGYYTNENPFGKEGDFVTAPEISQVFGELIASYLIALWQNNYSQSGIALVEMGAGKGTLMKDFLKIASTIPDFFNKVTINIVEISPRLQKIQQKNLQNYKNIKWWDDFDDFYQKNQKEPIFFIANELFDCFAIDQYVKIDNCWIEKLVDLDEKDSLRFSFAQRNQKINEIINKLTNNLGKEGDVFEYSKTAENFMLILSDAIKKSGGIAIVIDYGYVENKFRDTLQAIKKHKFSNILENIGESDVTSLVNFKRLEDIVRNGNLQSWIVTQKEFLESLGIEIRREKLLENKTKAQQDLINSAIDRLIDGKEMGELFKVLIISGAKPDPQ